MKILTSFFVAACIMSNGAFAEAPTSATTHTPGKPAKKTAKKPASKHHVAKAAEKKSGALLDDDDKTFDAGTDAVTEINCELGNKVTLYRNAADNEHMALRWNQRVHRMTRVSTTTGANRFENTRYGLVWIGIPGKGMLLDTKRGHQLANECKDLDQFVPPHASAEPMKSKS